ncbi:MAG: chemotaxis protein CheA [Paracoccus sp. (in: a-proteobacteria)]|uniref:chemotaxis protein CheA n=1 Tax=Paracoccus sp. TaxID=267 RepID=UPI004059E662
MDEMDEFREMFFVECDELLEGLANGLRKMEDPDFDKETVHAVFRAVHSIKGGAAAFALTTLVTFAHRFETLLDLIRSDRMDTPPQIIALLHRSSDCLSDLVMAARQSADPDQAHVDGLLAELDALIEDDDPAADTSFEFTPIILDFGDAPIPPPTAEEGIIVRMTPNFELYRSGNDPLALLAALRKLGDATVELNVDAVPLLEDWALERPQLRWTVRISGAVSEMDVRSVFEFVDDCCRLSISRIEEEQPVMAQLPMTDPVMDTPPSPTSAPQAPVAEMPPVVAPPAARPSGAVTEPAQGATIRVGLDRVDRLMNMIGELVIKEAMLSQVIQTAGLHESPDVVAGLDSIRQLAGDIQESVMAIRAQPLKLVFQRMHRILREAADATGKPVRLVTIGEQTEVDKTMIERLVDPLTHMIRNSVDHGLEDALTRQRRGKPQEGTITLSAAHRSGRVQIEISDDGGGINRLKVRQIAEDKGLIAPGSNLTPSEIDQLLFLPGFSSKEEVSALSGRGVGLDVVRREIMALGGRVMIDSIEGKGTTFSIALPLTLAVLEGMLIQLGGQTMVLPITAVQETLQPDRSMLHGVGRDSQLLANRGDLIPIIDLCQTFGLDEAEKEGGVLIVVESDSRKRAAFRVDGIFDQRQVVIKSLEQNYGRVPGVSAATILGDGKIALIIDPEEIILSLSNDHGRHMAAMASNG